MAILTDFLLRLSFGLALAMAVVSSRQVTSGYFRVHVLVVMGACALVALVGLSSDQLLVWPAATAAVLSYLASVTWLYEKHAAGKMMLLLVAAVALAGAWLIPHAAVTDQGTAGRLLQWLDPATSGLLLGSTLAAMLLGHWYLNNPSMKLAALEQLIWLVIAAIVLRAVLCGAGLVMEVSAEGLPSGVGRAFLAMRWLAGLAASLVVAVMALWTLRIPNTQSATGLLYVAVITTFLGELSALLLSAETLYPL